MMRKILITVTALATAAAAGSNAGDFYENGDLGHARLNIAPWPGVVNIPSYVNGYNNKIRGRDSVILGNASVLTSSDWYSITKSYYGQYSVPLTGWQVGYGQYRSNSCFFHPAVGDCDNQNDYFFFMAPWFLTSVGRSGSELDEMEKWFDVLNAFKPDVKAALKQQGTVMSVIQMISRRTRVASDAQYLTGAAHPSAFDNAGNRSAMSSMASAITMASLPPFGAMRVVEETYDSGMMAARHFGISANERYFTMPVSVARLFLGPEASKRIVLDADSSFDINNRDLTYHWRLLRGNSSQVTITPLNADSSRVEVTVKYHPKATIHGASAQSNLVVVGLFVHNGSYYSAPAFFTSYTMDNEVRNYDASTGRLKKISFNTNTTYWPFGGPRLWGADSMLYDQNGALSGWRRTKADSTWDFDAQGRLVLTRKPDGTPDSVQTVLYGTMGKYHVGITWMPVGSGGRVAAAIPVTRLAPAHSVPAAFYDLSGRRLASVQSRYSSVGRVMLRASARAGGAGLAIEASASPSRVSSAGDGGGQP